MGPRMSSEILTTYHLLVLVCADPRHRTWPDAPPHLTRERRNFPETECCWHPAMLLSHVPLSSPDLIKTDAAKGELVLNVYYELKNVAVREMGCRSHCTERHER
ncbi:hypothetical protein K438DRAFT_929293 [Mycena galopus ATCC 62051]|nr:hypothetical protein K438DRAFT_929293 [Mycena galopus ATCC 62051]